MKFKKIVPISRQEADEIFSSMQPKKICKALLCLAYYDPDYDWVQKKCIQFLSNSDSEVRRLAAISLGHIARIHQKIDLKSVLPLLKKMANDPEIRGTVEDVLSDINMFICSRNSKKEKK